MLEKESQKSVAAAQLAPVVVDTLALVLSFWAVPGLVQQLMKSSGRNALLFVVFYLLFCMGVYLVRKLETSDAQHGRFFPPDYLLDARIRAILAFIFGLVMMTTVAYQLGYFDSIQSIQSAVLDEGDSAALMVYMPGALLGFSMLYILVLAFPIRDNVPTVGRRSSVISFIGLTLINGMLVLCVAQARSWILLSGLTGVLWTWLASLVVLVISFGPPRVLFQSKFPHSFNFLSFSALLMILSWLVVR